MKGFIPLNEYYGKALERYKRGECARTPGFYAVIPVRILESKKLTPNEKLLFGELSALINKKGYCYATNEYLKTALACGDSSVTRGLKKLVELKIIKIELEKDGKGTWRKIWIVENLTPLDTT